MHIAKAAALACAGAVVLAVAGFGGASASASTSTPGSPVTLDFPSWQENEPGYTQFYSSMIAKFEKSHKNVKIHFYEVTYDNYVQTITTRMAADDPPDILVLPLTSYAQFAAQGDLTRLDSYLSKTKILSSWTPLQKSLKVNGHYYNVLMQGAGFALFVNKAILAAHHLSIPTTVSQLLSECTLLTGGGNYGIAMPTAQDPSAFDDASTFIVGEGHSVLSASGKSYDLTSPGVESAISNYRQLTECAAPGLVSDQMRQVYFSGKAAMMVDGIFGLPNIATEATASVKKNTVMVSLPLPRQITYVSSTLSIPSAISSTDKQLAWEFIQLCTQPASQALFVKDVESPAPDLSVDAKAHIPFASVQTAAVNGIDMIPTNPKFVENYNEIDTDFGTALSELISSNAAIGPVLSQLQSQLPPLR
jgi:ABC-type glycerol-3-phosphate transport system substrate-binding protein